MVMEEKEAPVIRDKITAPKQRWLKLESNLEASLLMNKFAKLCRTILKQASSLMEFYQLKRHRNLNQLSLAKPNKRRS